VRRANAQRLYQAKLAGLRNRVIRQWRQSPERADDLLAQLADEARERGLDRAESAYWDEGASWVEGKLAK
jgi:hypothetical protein